MFHISEQAPAGIPRAMSWVPIPPSQITGDALDNRSIKPT